MYKIGTRIFSQEFGYRAEIIAHDDPRVLKTYKDWSENERKRYIWAFFDKGGVNGWPIATFDKYFEVETIDHKIERLQKELQEAILERDMIKVGDVRRDPTSSLTATVKLVDDEFVFYTYVGTHFDGSSASASTKENFLKYYSERVI